MENQNLAEVESIQSDLALLSVVETNNTREKHMRSYDDFEKSKCKRNMFIDGKFEVPDDILVEKIIQQVEFLLSDANILKDKFLLKHLRRNKEGYISLKLVSSLRKVKALSKDWRVIAYSLKKSRKLQMNDEMTKIKRIDPLIQELDSSRTVLVFHFPPGCWTPENVKKELNKLGTVISMFTVNSPVYVMNINVRKALEIYRHIATFPFAVVMFDTSDEAANAVLQTSHPASIFKIVPLVDEEIVVSKSTPVLSLCESNDRFYMQNDITYSLDDNISSTALKSDLDPRNLKTFCEDNNIPLTSMTLKQDDKHIKPKKFRLPERDFLNVSHDKGVSFPPFTYRGDGPANNGWTHRRHFIGQHKDSRVIILRQPKGPDGTKGFRRHRLSASLSPAF